MIDLSFLPEVVEDDINNFIKSNYETNHLFSNIYEGGRNLIAPYFWLPYMKDNYINECPSLILYEGGVGFGNYMQIEYYFENKEFLFCTFVSNNEENKNIVYRTKNWSEMHSYVRKYLYDLFVALEL